MLKFLIGPVLVGAGYIAGIIYGADAEQLVHKSPSVTYAAVEQALANVRSRGTTFFDGGQPIPYELKIDRTLDRKLVVSLFLAGMEGAEAELTFTPQNYGKDTLIATRIHGDRSVLRTALAGTNKARLAYAPDWMLNLSAKPLLKQLADQIEQGGTADLGLTEGEAQAQWDSNLSDSDRQKLAEWRQHDATRPSVDPSADAEQHSSGGSN